MEEHLEIIELSNGFKGVIYQVNSPIVHVGVAIKAGSKYDEIPGTAHLAEHMLFKGTERRKAFQINNFLDVVGGELNAYTHKDELVVYASVKKEYLGRALDLLADLLRNATFPEKELIKEKAVVTDELHSYLDMPSEQIFDDFEELLFAGTHLGHPVLGNSSSIPRITRKDLQQFYGKRFFARNMAFSVVGDIKKKEKQLVEKYFSEIQEGNPESKKEERINEHIETNRFEATFFKPFYQTHVVLGSASYSYVHPQRRTLLLLNNIIGGPSLNSLLNSVLRERKGWTYNAESSVSTYEESGSFAIYFSCDTENTGKALNSVKKILYNLCEGKLSDRQLSNYKRQLVGHLALSNDNPSGLMLNLCKSLLVYGKVPTIREIEEEIFSIDKTQLREVAGEIVHPEKLSSIIYHSKK